MKCKKCGYENTNENIYCEKCGSILKCPKCKMEVSLADHYCPNCGENLNINEKLNVDSNNEKEESIWKKQEFYIITFLVSLFLGFLGLFVGFLIALIIIVTGMIVCHKSIIIKILFSLYMVLIILFVMFIIFTLFTCLTFPSQIGW